MDTSLLPFALRGILKASRLILKHYDGNVATELKPDDSPVTTADLAANQAIMEILTETGLPIISEENAAITYEERKEWNTYWVVDPLDGTKEFLKGNGEFTVNIALCQEQKPVLGLIGVPTRKLLYIGDTREGGVLRVHYGDPTIPVSQLLQNAHSLSLKPQQGREVRMAVSRSHRDAGVTELVKSLERQGKKVQLVSAGSALKFCLLAEGQADIYPRFSPTMEWDTAAGQAICETLGFRVLQPNGAPLRYNKEELRNPSFAVARPQQHPFLAPAGPESL